MVKYFHFYNTNPGQERHFDEQLKSEQCIYRLSPNRRCRKRCLMGLQMCWMHLQSVNNVRIRDAGDLGQGLFASDGTNENNIVFRNGDYIIMYEGGERMTTAQIDARYGHDSTGPYAVMAANKSYQDCAVRRCAASFINSEVGTGQAANCELQSYGRRRIMVVAIATIRNGEQLFCSYGPEYNFNEPGVWTRTDGRSTLY